MLIVRPWISSDDKKDDDLKRRTHECRYSNFVIMVGNVPGLSMWGLKLNKYD